MAIQTGTLVGAPIRVNDDQDTYPSAYANEIQGGLMSMPDAASRNAIPAARRLAGMLCYTMSDGNTWQLQNDSVTWSLYSGTDTSGDSDSVTLISGNFGQWTPFESLSTELINQSFTPSFKSDLQAFPSRAITYLQAQFGINSSFVGTSLLLGVLPVGSQPPAQILKYIICQNIEMFVQVDTNGNVTLSSKDGLNLPTTSGTPETQPIYFDLFFKPVTTAVVPTVYSSVRTASFTRNDCPSGQVGSAVSYSQTYTSTVDQATADALAAADTNFNTAGQAFANDTANGATCTVVNTANLRVVNNSATTSIAQTTIGSLQTGSIAPGNSYTGTLPTGATYNVLIKVGGGKNGSGSIVGCNGVFQQSDFSAQSYEFNNVSLPILIDLQDQSTENL